MFACSVAAASLVSPAVQRSSVAPARPAFARARTVRAATPDDDAASPTDSSLLDAFQERIDEEGGATRLSLSTDADRLSRGAGKLISDAGSAVNKALDLDGQAAEKNYPGRVGTPGGVLETGGWRLTVGFAAATIVFALYAAATTDFGDGGADAASCTGDESLCTRKEIENSRLAEIVARNNERALSSSLAGRQE